MCGTGQEQCGKGSGMYANMIPVGHIGGHPIAYEIQTKRFLKGYETPNGVQYVAFKV